MNRFIGILGTGATLSLSTGESLAAIFAGFSTGVYMLVSTYIKYKNKNKS